MYAKIISGKVVYPPKNDGNRVNVNLDNAWLAEHGFTDNHSRNQRRRQTGDYGGVTMAVEIQNRMKIVGELKAEKRLICSSTNCDSSCAIHAATVLDLQWHRPRPFPGVPAAGCSTASIRRCSPSR